MRPLGTLVFILALLPVQAQALDLKEFQEKMKKHIASLSGKTTAAVQMVLLGSDKPVFSYHENQKMIPASDAKLITAMAALEKLGPGFTFETKVIQKGNDLVLSSNGDPYLVSERLWLLAREVARSGVKSVGSIKVDNSAFSETYRGLTEFEGSGEPFTAQVSATSLNFNSLEIHVIPGPGERPRLEVGPVPNAYATLRNELTQTGGTGKNITVRPVKGGSDDHETFLVSGSVGRKAGHVIVYGAVNQPEAHIASAFAALLRKEGVTVAKDYGGSVSAPVGGETVASIESLPLQDLVRLFNNYSNNFMAEEVFQALGNAEGGQASLAKSRIAANVFLRRHAACAESVLFNGSGLAWDTRVSAHCFTEAMQVGYRDFHIFADLLGSLPAGGETGTLKHRFKRLGAGFEAKKVRGKTGTLWSKQVVTSLTGVTTTASGEKVLFSLIENDLRNDPGLLRELKDWEDKCVELVQKLSL